MSETFEEWGIRLPSGRVLVEGGVEEAARAELAWYTNQIPPVEVELMKREVTYTEWERADD